MNTTSVSDIPLVLAVGTLGTVDLVERWTSPPTLSSHDEHLTYEVPPPGVKTIAHNTRHLDTGVSTASVIHNFGRAESVDRRR